MPYYLNLYPKKYNPIDPITKIAIEIAPINKKPREDSISNKSEKNAQNDLHLSIDDSTNSLSNDPSNQSSKNNIIDYINNIC